jgi:hypothetical protein
MLRRAVFTQPGLRRTVAATSSIISSSATTHRHMSSGHDSLALQGPPQPPAVPQDPVVPMDFNPHIEWYEFPKEIFDPIYPYTREEAMRMSDERWDYSMEELAQKYGLRIQPPFKFNFWVAWLVSFWYIYYEIWSGYRATGNHPSWPQWRLGVMADERCPKIHDDEIYLDQWMHPPMRQKMAKVYDRFWAWKPLVSTNIVNPYAIEFRHRDPSEFKHMTGI